LTITLTMTFDNLESIRDFLDDAVVSGTQVLPAESQVTPANQQGMVTQSAPAAVVMPAATTEVGTVTAFAAEVTAAADGNGPELDSDGLPWDERIHAATKTKTAKGAWKKKRGVDEVEFGKVAGELQEQIASAQTTASQPEPMFDDTTAPAPTPVADPAALFGQPTPAPTPTPVADPAALFGQPASVAAPVSRTWKEICEITHRKQVDQFMDGDVFTWLCKQIGYSETEHGQGQQSVVRWAEKTSSQAEKNSLYDMIAALDARPVMTAL
jgi:hypothetical protein